MLAIIVATIFSGIFLSTNRSGWLTSGMLVVLMFSTNRQRIRMGLIMAIFAFLAYVVSEIVLAEADVVLERDHFNAAQSDDLRMQLIVRAISIGLENPLFGVSPTKLTRLLGAICYVDDAGIDCHNVTGYLIGGSGLLTFGAYCLFAFAMLRPPAKLRANPTSSLTSQAARILFIMTVTWLLRSQFQEDVLFSPNFTIGLGLCIGYCVCTGVYQPPATESSAYID